MVEFCIGNLSVKFENVYRSLNKLFQINLGNKLVRYICRPCKQIKVTLHLEVVIDLNIQMNKQVIRKAVPINYNWQTVVRSK